MSDLPPTSPDEARLLNYASGVHLPAQNAPSEEADCYRAAASLVVYNGATLPPRCLLCGGAGAGMPIKLSFTWDSSFTMTRISTLQLRQQAYVHAYLCAVHRGRWAGARRLGGVAFAASVLVMCGGMAAAVLSESADVPRWTPVAITLILLGFAGVIIALFFLVLRSRTLSCSKIQEGYLYLEGASAAFLEQLPAVRG